MCIRSCSLRRRARRPWATRAGCSAPSSLGWGLMCAATVTNKRKWLSTKNRSPQRSTPRHPIAMASTAKPLDPMSCALAAVLLPESRAHGCHVQKPLFPGPTPHVRGAYVLGPCLRAGCAQAAWAGGGSRSDALGAGRRCLAPRVGGGRWSGPARGGARLGGGRVRGRVVGRATRCLPAVRSRACVDAWAGAASGGSFRAVALVTVWDLGLMLHEQACYHS